MSKKVLIGVGVIVGGLVGGYIPALWGGSLLSGSSILLSGVGSIAGIYLGYKLGY